MNKIIGGINCCPGLWVFAFLTMAFYKSACLLPDSIRLQIRLHHEFGTGAPQSCHSLWENMLQPSVTSQRQTSVEVWRVTWIIWYVGNMRKTWRLLEWAFTDRSMMLTASLALTYQTQKSHQIILSFFFYGAKKLKRALRGLDGLSESKFSECSSVCFTFLSLTDMKHLCYDWLSGLWVADLRGTKTLVSYAFFHRPQNLSRSLSFSAQSALAWKSREALDFVSRCGQIHLCQWMFKIGTMQQLPQ